MGQVTFTSQPERIEKYAEKVYHFLADLNNFQVMMPERVTLWESTTDTCSFTIKDMAKIEFKIRERVPFSKVVVDSAGETPLDFDLTAMIEEKETGSCEVILELNADLSPMLKMIAGGPLQTLVNTMNTKLREHFVKGL